MEISETTRILGYALLLGGMFGLGVFFAIVVSISQRYVSAVLVTMGLFMIGVGLYMFVGLWVVLIALGLLLAFLGLLLV